MATRTRVWEHVSGVKEPRDHYVSSRKDLLEGPFKAAIGRVCDGTSWIVCGCREADRVWPELGVRVLYGNPVCYRRRVAQHAPDCIWSTIYGDEPDKPVATSLFGIAGTGTAPSGDYPDGESASGGSPDLNFPRLCTLSAAQAGTNVFLADNPSRPPRVQPAIAGFLSAWESVLRSWAFQGGLDAFSAARAEGVELKLGIVLDLPGFSVEGMSLLTGRWWEGGHVRPIAYAVSAEVLRSGCGRIRQRLGFLPPPYLTAVAVTAKGEIRHFWTLGIWTDGMHLLFAASGNERRHTAGIVARGGILHAPLRREDLDRLAPVLPATGAMMTWRYCPDAVIWWPLGENPERPEVKEVLGFEPGESPEDEEYHRHFGTKLLWYVALGPCYDFKIEEAWRDRSPTEPIPASAWRGPALLPGWLSPAALGLWRGLAARLGGEGNAPGEDQGAAPHTC
jgi:hypothetical protein